MRPGDELMGLAAALLSLGTHTLVTSVCPVPDVTTRELMADVYRRVGRGATLAQALSGAQAGATDRSETVARAAFVCYGGRLTNGN